ncbi:MAG: MlaD family protein [Myxococcaceae bacterium]
MSTNSKVGLVMLVGLIVAAWFILRIENVRVGRDVGDHYRIKIEDAQGLRDRSPVYLRGVRVGKVSTLKLDGEEVRIEVLLDPDVKLHEGALASVSSVGLLGEKELVITPGDLSKPVLPKDSVIKGTVAVSLDDVIAKLGAVGDNVVAITGSVRDAVGSDVNQDKVRQLIDSISGVVTELRTAIGENRDTFKETAESVQKFASATAHVAKKVDTYTGGSGPSDVKDQMSKIPELIDHLNETAKNLQEISEKINRGQGTIGQLVDSPHTAQKLESTLNEVSDGVKNLSGVMSTAVEVGLHADYLTAHDQVKGFFSMDVMPPGNGFLRVGLVAEPFSLATQRTVVAQSSPLDVTTTTKEQEFNSRIAFTGMLGYRYKVLVGRGGVIESRPGVGLDLLLLEDRLRISADAWDFSRDGTSPHLRGEAAVTVYRSIFLNAGWDEFLNTGQKLDSIYFGAGMKLHLLGE